MRWGVKRVWGGAVAPLSHLWRGRLVGALCGCREGRVLCPCRLCGGAFARVDGGTGHGVRCCRCLQRDGEPVEDRGADFRFRVPSSILIVGPSSCGGACFAKRLLLGDLELFRGGPKAIVCCASMCRGCFGEMGEAGVRFHGGVPGDGDLDGWFPEGRGVLILVEVPCPLGNHLSGSSSLGVPLWGCIPASPVSSGHSWCMEVQWAVALGLL